MPHYIALIHNEPESGYGVSFPDVPGVIAVADTLDEALQEAAVALGFAFEDCSGKRPQPRTLDELRRDSTFIDQSSDAVVAALAPADLRTQEAHWDAQIEADAASGKLDAPAEKALKAHRAGRTRPL